MDVEGFDMFIMDSHSNREVFRFFRDLHVLLFILIYL